MKQRRAYSRGEQKERILNVFVENIQAGGDGHLTMNYIAHAIDLVPSQHVTDILHELHVEGSLICNWEMRPGRWAGRMWWLANDSMVKRPVRAIKINGDLYNPDGVDVPF
jgi:hypothetical protein